MFNFVFRGNVNLRPVGMEIEYTQHQLEEWIKCENDPIYFIKNYVKIISLDRGLVPFALYPYQEEFILALHENRRVISIQPRQSGKTQVVAAYIAWYLLFNDDKTVAILANKASAAREIMSRLQKMYENLPTWLQHGIKTWNKGDIELENGSKAFTAATTGTAVTGKSVNFLMIDEAALIPNTIADEFFTSAYPTLSSGQDTKIVLTSTPRGYNFFWSMWTKAEDPNDEFIPIRVRWQDHPNRDQAWADEQMRLIGALKFRQEVECAFLGSSSTLISGEKISQLVPTRPEYSKDGLDILEMPKHGHIYSMVCDTSKGVGGDYSAFTVVDMTELPYTVVAKYRDNSISPMLYPSIIYNTAKQYNDAYVLLEINSSEQVAYILQSEMEYENLLYVTREKSGQVISSGFAGQQMRYGVNTDKKVKRIGCNNLKMLIEENKLLVSDVDIISELSTFIEHRDSYAADDGYHDDLVMTLVLFAWLTTNTYFKSLTNINLRTSLYEERMRAIEDQITPIGHHITGNEEEVKGVVIGNDYWVFAEPNEFSNDF